MTEEQLYYELENNEEAKRLWSKVIFRLGSNSLIRLVTDDDKYTTWVNDMDTLRAVLLNKQSDATF